MKDFKWDPKRLGLEPNNTESYYTFSIPLFSADKKQVVLHIEYLEPYEFGWGETILCIWQGDHWRMEELEWYIS